MSRRTRRAGLLLLPAAVLFAAWCGRSGFGATGSWALCTAVNVVAVFLAANALHRKPLARTLWLWSLLTVYVFAIVVQGGWYAYKLHTDRPYFAAEVSQLQLLTPEQIGASYSVVTVVLVFLCVAISAIATRLITPASRHPLESRPTRSPLPLTMLAFWAYALFTAVQVWLGLGTLGTSGGSLPFRSQTLVFFYRQELFPAFVLLALWIFDSRRSKRAWIPLACIALATVVEAVISTSRGTILYYGIPVVFLWALTGRFTNGRRVVVAVGVIAYLVSTPLLTAMRVERLTGSASRERLPIATAISETAARTVTRIGGIEQLWLAEPYAQPFALQTVTRLGGGYISETFTNDIYQVRRANDFRVGGVMGGGMLVGGVEGIVTHLSLLMAFTAILWRYIVRQLHVWPVALALVATEVIIYFSEGSNVQMVKMLLEVAFLEVAYRFWLRVRQPERREAVAVSGVRLT